MHDTQHRLRVALVGFGHVGTAVARMLTARDRPPGLVLDTICTRDAASRRVAWVGDSVRWTAEFGEVLDSDADVVVELIGGLEPATTWIEQALARGKSVVTANKQVIAERGERLEAAARARGCELRFEASVGGVVPVIRALRGGLAADRVRRIEGILNGTCNYILSAIDATRAPFGAALAEAQASGFAEADPSTDVDGLDARAKLAILATLAFRRPVLPHVVRVRSIRGIDGADFEAAREKDCTIRQIAWADCVDGSAVRAEVGPVLVPVSSVFGRTTGSDNVIVLSGERAGDVVLTGRGAGPEPTAVAVVSDLLSIARRRGRSLSPYATRDARSRDGVSFPRPRIRFSERI